ncbi:hypothetical protein SARC_02817 [Sphaeroforma arctica JP610]|uniref:Tyr recombinase domain-containing protein n=1 Tax=Sphaeroforma arctica JP610 TaxID=667725 RepID=A0A0L0G7E5_9EUKA|nr:hypothetical protein SARC_02817 [Sphaeroforma arctica JP610]KNC84962.1 hypothetical protein SARC_02817 [Sphaeroforma arctica JP610]|eukprot:XP_014158864.1 hypothetical protein SARC_02817 [Sphaeroforma arctica JP610]
MPRIAIDWDPVDMMGNPTKSKDVNDLLKTIERAELRAEGKDDAAKRPIEYDEFRQILAINLEKRNYHNGGLHALWTLTFPLICRVDDVTNIKFEDLTLNDDNPEQLIVTLVRKRMLERTNTHQLDLGYMCTLNGTVGWDDKLKPDVARRAIAKIVRLDNFVAKGEVDEIGTHSLRKCSCTYAQRRGRLKN